MKGRKFVPGKVDCSEHRNISHASCHRVLLCLWCFVFALTPAFAQNRDPLFGDLPQVVQTIDQALMDVGAEDRFGQLIDGLSSRIASEASISGLAPGGVRYEIGPLGLPTRVSTSLGTIWTTSSEPLGKGRLSIGAGYTHLKFDSFEGDSLDSFLDFDESNPPVDIDLEMETRIFSLSALYGITRDWEAGVFVPYVFHRSRGDIFLGERRVGHADGSTEGLGDILLLSKYRLGAGEDWSWSLSGRLKLPTGDKDDYLGTGKTDVQIQALLMRRINNLEINLAAGYTWSGLGRDFDSIDYQVAFAYGLTDEITLVHEWIGRHSEETIFDTLDVGFGIKWNPFGGLVVQGGVRFPLDQDGLRAEAVPSVGLEWRF
jgi:hypothetical protein